MNTPLFAFDGKTSDYDWYPVEETPAPAPAPTKTVFYCRDKDGTLVEAGLFFERYAEARLADPIWCAEQQRKRQEKSARHQARLERIAERKRRKNGDTK